MFRARIGLAATLAVAILTAVVAATVSSSIKSATRASVEATVSRAQQAVPKLVLLRGVELTNETVKLAREDEIIGALGKAGDERRQAAFVAVEAMNGRLEKKGRKADLILVTDGQGKVVCRNLNMSVMVGEDLKSRYGAVAKALEGVAVKDVWGFEGRLYDVAVAPVRGAAGVLGTFVVGYAASTADAQGDHDRTGAEVAFVLDKKVHASSWKRSGGESAEEKALTAAIDQVQDGVKVNDAIAKGEVTKVFAVTLNGQEYLAAAGPLPGNLTPSEKTAAGYVVLSSVTAARAPYAGLLWWVLLLGGVSLLAVIGAAVLTAMRFLVPIDAIERGVSEVINGNHEYTFEAPSPDLEGLANGLNVMIARLTGRPDPTDDEGGSASSGEQAARWGGELAVDANVSGAHATIDNQALAEEPEAQYLQRLFAEYVEARKQTNEGTEGLTFDSFAAKVKQNEAGLRQKYNCRMVRFKVAIKNGQATLKPVPIN
jgi:hypothetical protein